MGECLKPLDENKDGTATISLTEIFIKHFPFYLAIGMTYDEYWHGEAWLTKSYREAYNIKKEVKDYELWKQGMYFYEALLDVSPILHAFAKKGTKPKPYSDKPYGVEKEQDEFEKEEQAERERLKAKLHFIGLSRLLKRQFGE